MHLKRMTKMFCLVAIGMVMVAFTAGGVHAQDISGMIAERYKQLGGASGPLGPVTSIQMAATDGRGQYYLYKNGMIAYSGPTGPKSMQVIYRVGHKVTFQWGTTDPFNYDKFILRWTINNGSANQVDVNGQGVGDETFRAKASRTDGTFTISLDPKDSISIIVEGADKGTFGSTARQGWTTPVWVGTAPAAPQPPLVPPAISVTCTGANTTSVFTVTGSGFKPNTLVNIRVVDDLLNPLYFSQTSNSAGQLLFKINIPCNGGYYLYFSATDRRPNPKDQTGSLWSNTFKILCPGGSQGGSSGSDGGVDTQSKSHKATKKIGALTGMNNVVRKRLEDTPRLHAEDGGKTKP